MVLYMFIWFLFRNNYIRSHVMMTQDSTIFCRESGHLYVDIV